MILLASTIALFAFIGVVCTVHYIYRYVSRSIEKFINDIDHY
jgi:hypothetical protein